MNKTIGIIGGGAAGLCAIKHCLQSKILHPIAWEQTDNIGGTWVYSSGTGKDSYGLPIHSSMYQNLKTNLPKEVMGFPDFPFPEGGESFIHHTEVLKYLQNYTTNYNLEPYIKFSHHVEYVEPQDPDNPNTSWLVKAKNLANNTLATTICDGIIVCNGHYSVARYPNINNHDNFKGLTQHSHDYRDPSQYQGLRVAVLGASNSGIDISLEISQVATQIYICHNQPVPLASKLPSNVEQVKGIVSATSDGFILNDGSNITVDALLYCTGYEYIFPFLSKSCGISVIDNQVVPLYKHMININYPTMAFIGLPYKCLPFLMFDLQIQLFTQAITGQTSLPPKDEMLKDSEDEKKNLIASGLPVRYFHRMGGKLQWNYNRDIAKIANVAPHKKVIEDLYDYAGYERRNNVMTYKNDRYIIDGPDTFKKLETKKG